MDAPQPRTGPPFRPNRGRGLARALVGLGGLAAIVVLLVGLPALLWWATRIVLEAGLDDLTHLLDRQDTGGAFLLMLAAVGWIAWAQFAMAVLLEIPAQVRGRTAPRLRGLGLGMTQRAAATLVGSILVLLPTGTALASPASAQAATATPTPGHDSERSAAQHDNAAPTETSTTSPHRLYTVQNTRPAESLWGIAERQLGHGHRWEEIAELNEGRTMADGQVFHTDGPIQPGWQLRLPEARDGVAPQGESARSVTVTPGDTLSGIAEEELADPTAWPEIFDLNRGERQPGGGTFTDPDLIYPGQALDLPAQESSPSAPNPKPDSERGGRGEQPGQAEEDAPQAPPAQPSSPAPTGQTDETEDADKPPPEASKNSDGDEPGGPAVPGQPSATGGTERPSGSPTRQAPHSPEPSTDTGRGPASDAGADQDDGGAVPIHVATGIAALLAASLLGGLGIKRTLQRRRRRPGQRIAMPAEASPLEQVLHVTSDAASVDLLDAALRTMAHQARAQGQQLPDVRGARVTTDTVQLLVDGDGTPMVPFTADEGGWWTLPARDRDTLLPADEARQVYAPYPGLVTVGTGRGGATLLTHLPHIRALLLDGAPEQVLAVTRSMALEAATCAWADHAEILCVGLGTDLATLLPQGRFRAVSSVQAAARDLGEMLLEAHQDTDARGGEALVMPWVLICATLPDPEHVWQLADALAKTPRHLPIAVVLPAAGEVGQAFPDAERLDAATEGPQRCDLLGTSVTVQACGPDAYEQFLQALRIAEEPAPSTEEPWHLVPDPDARPQPGPATPPSPAVRPAPEPAADPGDPRTSQSTPYPALVGAADPSALPRLLQLPDHTDGTAGGEEPDAAAAAAEDTDEQHSETLPSAPQIHVLGPVQVTGIESSGHGIKVAALAALIYFRPGRTAAELCKAMDPISPWSTTTFRSRISQLRNRLGEDPQGKPYLPRHRSTYRLPPAVTSDWDRLQHLATKGLRTGPPAGMADLEAALTLVRGKPFSGALDYPWASPLIQEMLTRIVDIAHTIATWRTSGPTPDLDNARHAISIGLDVDDTAELLYQDWIRLEDQAGNRAGVHAAIEQLQTVNRRLDVEMESATHQLIHKALSAGEDHHP